MKFVLALSLNFIRTQSLGISLRLHVILSVLCLSPVAFADFTIDLGLGQTQDTSEQNQTEAPPSFDFKAKDYFATRYDGSPVDPSWPSRVTFESIPMRFDRFQAGIIGQWQVMFACEGRLLSSDEILSMSPNLTDGYRRLGFLFEFTQTHLNRYSLTPVREVLQWTTQEKNFYDSIGISWSQESESSFKTRARGFEDTYYETIRINETGEIIIKLTDDIKCPSGEPFEGLLIPINAPPMS